MMHHRQLFHLTSVGSTTLKEPFHFPLRNIHPYCTDHLINQEEFNQMIEMHTDEEPALSIYDRNLSCQIHHLCIQLS